MLLWPVVTLVGFLLLTALVIAMGTHSTSRYETEKRTAVTPSPRGGVRVRLTTPAQNQAGSASSVVRSRLASRSSCGPVRGSS